MMIAEKSDNINGEKEKNQTIPPIQKQPPLTPWSALFQMIFFIDTSWDFFFLHKRHNTTLFCNMLFFTGFTVNVFSCL